MPLRRSLGTWFPHSFNSNATVLAIAYDDEIDIYDLGGIARGEIGYWVLTGHTSPIESVTFSPTNPNLLVTSASGGDEPVIIIWNLDAEGYLPDTKSTVDDPVSDKKAGDKGEESRFNSEEGDTASSGEKHTDSTRSPKVLYRSTQPLSDISTRLCGRLATSFQSNVFNPSGTRLLYLPGRSAPCNTKDAFNKPQHDIYVYDIKTRTTVLTLAGHTDAIMWLGYSPDGHTIASVSWDQTVRIWDARMGNAGRILKTDGQNWAGSFSPDSKRFLGTCGNGTVHIWDLHSGEQIWSYKFDQWCRLVGWSPDGGYIAVGQDGEGGLALFDVSDQQDKATHPLCQWILNLNGLKKKVRRAVEGQVSIRSARLLPASSGRIAVLSTTFAGVELYDIEKNLKWRYTWGEAMRRAGWTRFGAQYLEQRNQIAVLSVDTLTFCDITV
jgi:WD40 repeat protein